ncbi:MAG: hypothetical protein WDZ59_14675 [Pirellulales bacterium]
MSSLMSSLLILVCLLNAPQQTGDTTPNPPAGDRYEPAAAAPLNTLLPDGSEGFGPGQPDPESPSAAQPSDIPDTAADPQSAASPGGETSNPPAATPPANSAQQTPAPTQPQSQGGPAASEPAELVPVRNAGPSSEPEVKLRKLLTPPANDPIEGTPVTLAEALSGMNIDSQQAEVIRAYWNLSRQIGGLVAAEDLARGLDELVNSRATNDAQLALGLAEAQLAVADARVAVVEAQHDLAERRAIVTSAALPLPADRPHAGAYRTYYETIFAGRSGGQARRIHDALTPRLRQIRAGAAAVSAADRWASEAAAAYGERRLELQQVLDAYRALDHHQKAFLDAVLQYNLDIAEYARLVAPQGTDGSQLVTMLIKTTPPTGTSTQSLPPDRLNSVLKRREPTLATTPPGEDSGVVQASGESESPDTTQRPRDGFVPRSEP